MKIVCPSCRVPVAAADVDLGTGMARCRTCGNVFRFADDPELAPRTGAVRPPVEKPRSVVTREDDGALTLEYRWFMPRHLFLMFFCLVWDGILVFWYAAALRTGDRSMLLYPLLHVAIGLSLSYFTLAAFVNRTTVRIDGSRIRVRHHPLPWGRNVELGTADVRQLFCRGSIPHGRNTVSYRYDLVALMGDGTRRKLVGGLGNPELPLYLEQHAEQWMKIRDEPVTGELVR
jgi:hypothetical protein